MSRQWLTDSDIALLRDAAEAIGSNAYEAGLDAGLNIAEQIRGWLTREPDNEWQREVRQWADKAIEKARETLRRNT